MNREIKFRVWNGTQMEYKVMAGYLGAFYVQGMDENDAASMSPFNTKYFPETPLMQFTGLVDKNGKEIYEGDRVRTDEAGWVAKVVFERGMFCCKDDKGGFSTFCNWEAFEVIGNVYEEV